MLLPGAEPELGHIEDAIDHVEAAADTIVGKFGLACRTDDEERRSLPDRDARWKLDKRLPPVVEGAERPPCRLIAADNVVEMKAVDRQALRNRCRSRSLLGGPAQCDQLVRGIRSEEHTSELQSLMRISYSVFCLKKKK